MKNIKPIELLRLVTLLPLVIILMAIVNDDHRDSYGQMEQIASPVALNDSSRVLATLP